MIHRPFEVERVLGVVCCVAQRFDGNSLIITKRSDRRRA